MSSSAAVSRTDRVTTPSWARPAIGSPRSGPNETRPRDGFKPTRPHSLAGMRIEPPPSFACAAGTSPAATDAAEPPLEPPVERLGSHGFLVGPYASGSVVGSVPISGVVVLPRSTKPAARRRAAVFEAGGATKPA